jgi:hypothetical protein
MRTAWAALILAAILLAGCTVGQAQLQQAGSLRVIGPPAEPASDCVDSDSTFTYGDDTYYSAGFVITGADGSAVDSDRCKGDRLVEYSCEYGHKKHVVVACPHGCFDGACLSGAVAAMPEVAILEPSTAPVI